MDGQSLTLVRGTQGAGKTDFALWLMHGKDQTVCLSADHYMVGADGKYKFDPAKLKAAHKKCYEEAAAYLESGYSVVVHNTFSQEWEFQPYVDLAAEWDVKMYSIVVEHRHAKRNIHGVSDTKVKQVAQRFDLKLTNA
jgi:predicted kinase